MNVDDKAKYEFFDKTYNFVCNGCPYFGKEDHQERLK